MGIIKYFKGIVSEFHHITWPNRKTVIIFTIVTVIVSFALAYYMGLLDWIFSRLLEEFIIS